MRLIAGRQKVGGDIPFGGDVSDDFDLVFDLGQLGEKLRLRVAVQNVSGDHVALRMGLRQTIGVGLIEEHLRFKDVCRLLGDLSIVTQCQIKQHAH